MSNRITQFCMGYTELQGCKGICFPITQIKATYCSTIFQHQHHCRPLLLTLDWGHCNCVQFKWFWMLRGSFKMSHNVGDLVCHSLSLSLSLSTFPLSSEQRHQASSRKRLPYNLRCRGWGPHLGDIASLIPYCSWARSFLLYPLLWRLPKRKHCSNSWVSGMFNYLVKAQKGFWCPRIKVCIIGGIGSYICKLYRCSKGVWTKTLMGVLLSRGWHWGEILSSLAWSWFDSPHSHLVHCLAHPSILILSLLILFQS